MKKIQAKRVITSAVTALCAGVILIACASCGSSLTSDPISLTQGHMEIDTASFTYNSKTQMPIVTVYDQNGNKLNETNYKLSWQSRKSKAVGTYKVTAKGVGNYTGKLELSYKIKRAKLRKSCVKLSNQKFTYDGKKHRPKLTITGPSGEKIPKRYRTVKWHEQKSSSIGRYYVTVTGKGPYSGSVKRGFKITRIKITISCVKLGKKHYYYDGTSHRPSVTVRVTTRGLKRTLIEGEDYSVKYYSNTSVGTAYVQVKGKGIYSSTVRRSFTIEEDPRWPTTNSALSKIPVSQRWYNSSAHVGTHCTIAGPVVNVYQATQSAGMPVFVDIGTSYPSSDSVSLVIWAEDLYDFEDMLYDVGNGHAWIQITGYLSSYNGRPQFNSNNPLHYRWWTGIYN